MERRGFLQNMVAAGTVLTGQQVVSALEETTNLPRQDRIMPVLFIGHGNPMNGISVNRFSKTWVDLGRKLPRPQAVICVSAHWLTRGTAITAMPHPRTIHDFGNISPQLFRVQYRAPGNPELAAQVRKTIRNTNLALNHDWGLDHGCWSVVRHMYPNADIPILQLSIDYHQRPEFHYELGKQLGFLRERGVLVIGSGNMVHNTKEIGFARNAPFHPPSMDEPYGHDWAIRMNEVFKKLIEQGDHEALIKWQKLGPDANLAIPTPDHYYPLLYSLAMQRKGEPVRIMNDHCFAGSISMTSVQIG